MGFAIFLFILFIVFALTGFFTVKQQTAAIVERFGRFKRIAGAGLNFKVPLIDKVAGRISLRVQQLDVRVETKTKDNVFVNVIVSVQYFVIPEKVVDAFYKLQNAESQITSYVYDVVRARVPNIILDDVFETKDDIAQAVKLELEQIMDDFGYGIVKALVTDIDPDAKVKASMNEINAAQRLRVAAVEQAEADKIRVVKAAEAEAESKALQGKGIADQRTAIVNGLQESVSQFKSTVELSSNSNTIMIPHSPSGMNDISEQLRSAMIQANEVSKSAGKAGHQNQKV
jgi:regulator of protease activity HflC (stomatin/prohibitin superfamily)